MKICITAAMAALLLLCPPARAEEQEKMVAPELRAPGAQDAPAAAPGGAGMVIQPGPEAIMLPPAVSVPDEPREAPGLVVEPPAAAPLGPETVKPGVIAPMVPLGPKTEKPGVIAPVVPLVPERPLMVQPPAEARKKPEEPEKETPKPEKEPDPLSPAQFLPQTDIKKPEPPKKRVEAPKPKAEPPQKPPQKVGEELRIPKDAAKTGKKDFLEGCWRGKADGRYGDGKQARGGMTFCFDQNGRGRREWIDERRGETCHGAATARVDASGVLHIVSGDARCPSGEVWQTKEIVCRDNGRAMECRYIRGAMSVGPFVRR